MYVSSGMELRSAPDIMDVAVHPSTHLAHCLSDEPEDDRGTWIIGEQN